ncbi:GNAT family N-acetyltransferase [Pseudomonas sp. NR3]|uniref:GNAT family N-acetyltransferase n=1 Tax=Pseudomonas sp. NR3 TaxID=3155978 RepID=UPI003B672254
MTITIRLAHPDDAPFLPDVEKSAARAFSTIEALSWVVDSVPMPVERHQRIIALSTCWVAVNHRDLPQGLLSAERYDEALHVHELSVMQSEQRQGIGRRLMEIAMAHARAKGLLAITLTTFKNVPWNAPFYARLGFEQLPEATLAPRLAAILAEEYRRGFAPGSRCAMSWRVC